MAMIKSLSQVSLVQYWPIFYFFLMFGSYFTCEKARELSLENMRNS